jgi:hypothetical protein
MQPCSQTARQPDSHTCSHGPASCSTVRSHHNNKLCPLPPYLRVPVHRAAPGLVVRGSVRHCPWTRGKRALGSLLDVGSMLQHQNHSQPAQPLLSGSTSTQLLQPPDLQASRLSD